MDLWYAYTILHDVASKRAFLRIFRKLPLQPCESNNAHQTACVKIG